MAKKKKEELVKKQVPKKVIKPTIKTNKNGIKSKAKNGSGDQKKPKAGKNNEKPRKEDKSQKGKKDQIRTRIKTVPRKKQPVKPAEKLKKKVAPVVPSKPKKKPVKKKPVKKRRTKPLTEKQKEKQRLARNLKARKKRSKDKRKKEKASKRSRKYARQKRAERKVEKQKVAKKESKKLAKKRKDFDKILKAFFKRRKSDIKLHGRGAFKRVAGRIWLDYKDTLLSEIEQTLDEIILNYIEEDVLDVLDENGKPIEISKHSKIENLIIIQWGTDIFPWWESLEVFQSIMANRSWDHNMFIKIVDDQNHSVYIKTNSELEGKFWNLISYDRNHGNPPFDRVGSSFIHVNYVEKQKVGDEYVFVFHVSDWVFPTGRWDEELPTPTEPVPAKEEGKTTPEEKPSGQPAKTEPSAKLSDKEIELELQKEKTKEAEAKAKERESISKSITDIRVMVERGDIEKSVGQEMIKKLLGL